MKEWEHGNRLFLSIGETYEKQGQNAVPYFSSGIVYDVFQSAQFYTELSVVESLCLGYVGRGTGLGVLVPSYP